MFAVLFLALIAIKLAFARRTEAEISCLEKIKHSSVCFLTLFWVEFALNFLHFLIIKKIFNHEFMEV